MRVCGVSSALREFYCKSLRMHVTEYQETVLDRRVTWPDLVLCFQKITPGVRVEDGLVNEEAAGRIWLRDNDTSTNGPGWRGWMCEPPEAKRAGPDDKDGVRSSWMGSPGARRWAKHFAGIVSKPTCDFHTSALVYR